MRTLTMSLILSVWFTGISSDNDEEDKKIADDLLQKHVTLVEQITSLKCMVENTHTDNKYRKNGNIFYARADDVEYADSPIVNGKGYLCIRRSGMVSTLAHNDKIKPDKMLGHIRGDDVMLTFTGEDFWTTSRFREVSARNTNNSKKVDAPNNFKLSVTDCRIGKMGCKKVTWTYEVNKNITTSYRIYAPDYNGLCIVYHELRTGPERFDEWETRLGDVKDFGDGIYLPQHVENVSFDKQGRETVQHKATFTEMKINDKKIKETMKFEFPVGCMIEDRVQLIYYKLGKDGKPDGEVLKLLPPPQAKPSK